jgi:hypothetical protein
MIHYLGSDIEDPRGTNNERSKLDSVGSDDGEVGSGACHAVFPVDIFVATDLNSITATVTAQFQSGDPPPNQSANCPLPLIGIERSQSQKSS